MIKLEPISIARGRERTVRTAIFSAAAAETFRARKRLELAFVLDFLFLFRQGKRKEKS